MAKIIQNKKFTTQPVIDWLTLRINYIGGQLLLSKNYSYKIKPYTTRVFKRVIEIQDNNTGQIVATITDMPTSEAIRQDLVLIKFHNNILYQADLKKFVFDFCAENSMKIEAVSRVDIAIDFTNFENNLNPELFIKRFLGNKYIKAGRGRYQINGKAETADITDFKNIGNYGKKISYEYLKFGSHNNGLVYYLYNKSKELRDKTDKPYIRENWKTYGHDGNTDIWRLEFSITSNNLRFLSDNSGAGIKKKKAGIIENNLQIDTDTGEATEVIVHNLKDIEIIDSENLIKIYSSLVNKYFVFFYHKKSRKDRNKKLVLFTQLSDHIAYTCERSLEDTSRTDKMFISNLRKTYEDLRYKDVYIPDNGRFALQKNLQTLLIMQVQTRALENWAQKKDILNFEPGNKFEYKPEDTPVFQQPRAKKKGKKQNKEKPPD